jgi:murein L,D-transpeptidase YcbB/YkuD
VDLARRLLRDDPAWPQPRIDAALAAGRNVRVDLARPILLHLVYDTAWVDDDGTVNFRNDAYGRDSTIAALRTASAVHPGNNCGA